MSIDKKEEPTPTDECVELTFKEKEILARKERNKKAYTKNYQDYLDNEKDPKSLFDDKLKSKINKLAVDDRVKVMLLRLGVELETGLGKLKYRLNEYQIMQVSNMIDGLIDKVVSKDYPDGWVLDDGKLVSKETMRLRAWAQKEKERKAQRAKELENHPFVRMIRSSSDEQIENLKNNIGKVDLETAEVIHKVTGRNAYTDLKIDSAIKDPSELILTAKGRV